MREQTNKTKQHSLRARSLRSGKRNGIQNAKGIYEKLVDIEDVVEMIARQMARETKSPKCNGAAATK